MNGRRIAGDAASREMEIEMMKWISISVCVVLWSGCQKQVLLESSELAEISSAYRTHAEVTLIVDNQPITVTPEMKPQLFIDTTIKCPMGKRLTNQCDDDLVARFSTIQPVDDDKLELVVQTSFFLNKQRRVRLQESEVKKARLSFDFREEDWRPVWAFGAMFFGPAGFVGPQVHWMPIDQLVFDIGAMGAPHVGVFFGGVRLRPIRFGNVLPFVGGAANAISGPSSVSADGEFENPFSTRVGPKAGVDWELSKRRLLLGFEAELFYNVRGDGFIYGDEGRWQPFGGVYLAYQL